MKLGTLKSESFDGTLVVVSKDNKKAVRVSEIAKTFQEALDTWKTSEPKLKKIYEDLNAGKIKDSFPVNEEEFHSPLPRAYQWLDGSAYLQHVRLVRKSRGAELPKTLEVIPLMYQGGSDNFLAPREGIPCIDTSHGVDLEAEVGVITDFVPMGTKAADALKYVRFLVIINDVSLRGLIPEELERGFGFVQGKPASSFAPFALTPDELSEAWKNGKFCLPLLSEINGEFFGNPDAGDMHFNFGQLIEHAARTRNLCQGTIIGSGTVSNEDVKRGHSCLLEKRMLEKMATGEYKTPFLKPGDTVKIEMKDKSGNNLFGTIFQKVHKV